VFATALVKFQADWYLYWGADDKWIDGATVDLSELLTQKGEEEIEPRVCLPLATVA
jgi:predicted GH43/DUF377 family glycosyl hydrolase